METRKPSAEPDWPVNLATAQIRTAFLNYLLPPPGHDKYFGDSAEAMRVFYNGLTGHLGKPAVKKWLSFGCEALLPDVEQVCSWLAYDPENSHHRNLLR